MAPHRFAQLVLLLGEIFTELAGLEWRERGDECILLGTEGLYESLGVLRCHVALGERRELGVEILALRRCSLVKRELFQRLF